MSQETLDRTTQFYVIGDLHFRVDNVLESKMFIQKTLENIFAKDRTASGSHGIKYIVVLGDVLHTHERLHTTPMNIATSFLKELSTIRPTFVLVGNHDMINNQQYLNNNHWMHSLEGIKNLTIVDKVVREVLSEEGDFYLFMPYVPSGRFREALKEYNSEENNTLFPWKQARCIFAHQEFRGCNLGAKISDCEDVWKTTFPYVVSGHIHITHSPQENIFYTGEAIPTLTRTNNVLLSFSSDKNPPTIEKIDLNLQRKINYRLTVDEIESFTPESLENSNNVYVKTTKEEFKVIKKRLQTSFPGIKIHREPEEVRVRRELNTNEEITFTKILETLLAKEERGVIKLYRKLCV